MADEEHKDSDEDEDRTVGDADDASEPSSDSGDNGNSGGKGAEDLSGTTAPSIGPNTTIEREDPEERLARHEQSDTDAMGLDKRREVVGGTYGPTFAKQATLYGGVLAIIAAIVIGFIILAGKLDQPPDQVEPQAPWATEADAPNEPPAPIQ